MEITEKSRRKYVEWESSSNVFIYLIDSDYDNINPQNLEKYLLESTGNSYVSIRPYASNSGANGFVVDLDYNYLYPEGRLSKRAVKESLDKIDEYFCRVLRFEKDN